MKLTKLVHLGLEEKEARIYLACLELGYASVQGMAFKAGTNRVSSYIIIERLKAKGLINTTYKGKRKVYMAAPPEKLCEILKDKKRAVDEEIKNFENDFLPELKGIENKSEKKPKVSYHEINKGIEILRNSNLRSKDKIIYSLVPISKVPHKYKASQEFRKRLRRKKKEFNEIWIANNKEIWEEKFNKDNLLRSYVKKVIKAKQSDDIDCEICANDKKVHITRFSKDPFVLVIEDESIYNAIKYLIKEAQK